MSIAAGIHGQVQGLVPEGSWPAMTTRLVALMNGGKALYVGAEIERLMASGATGAAGYLLSAYVMRQAGSPLSGDLAKRGHERLTAESFHKDIGLLFDSRFALGRLMTEFAVELRDMPAEDVEAIAAVMPPAARELLTESVQSMRASADKPLYEVLAPVFDAAWENTIRSQLESQLTALASQ